MADRAFTHEAITFLYLKRVGGMGIVSWSRNIRFFFISSAFSAELSRALHRVIACLRGWLRVFLETGLFSYYLLLWVLFMLP